MRAFLTAGLVLWSCAVFGQKLESRKERGGPSPVSEQASALELLYQKAFSATGVEKAKAERQFFEAFPASYRQFNRVYGAIDSADRTLFGPLYERPEHVALFTSLNTIPKKEYCAKQIGIALGGQWDADNVSAFQRSLQDRVMKEPAVFASLLKARSEQEARSFWWFLLDSPHPGTGKKYYERLYTRVKPVSPALALWLKEEHSKLLEESGGHGI